MALEIQVEEARAELSNTWDLAERWLLVAEIDLARAELELIMAERMVSIYAEPPF